MQYDCVKSILGYSLEHQCVKSILDYGLEHQSISYSSLMKTLYFG